MDALGWMILAPVGLLFAVSSWRFLLGLTALDTLGSRDIPIHVTPQTAVWAAMTIFSGLLLAICLV
jgi:hypothetical protein